MRRGYFVGFDTSCYTTSTAVSNEQGKIVFDERISLQVPKGSKGLKQSDCVLQHVENLPKLILKLKEFIDWRKVVGIAASVKPRPLEDSHMPVFLVSKGMGTSLASVMQVPFLPLSHQEGHLMAGIYSSGFVPKSDFLAVHFSGGTSELLKVKCCKTGGFQIEILGQSEDLYAGQFIDRVGVNMGMSFPSGPELEKLAMLCSKDSKLRIPSSVKGYSFSFSGPESFAQRLINKGEHFPSIARAVEICIAKTIEKIVRRAVENYEIKDVLFIGGVMANQFIRSFLKKRLEHKAVGAKLHFCEPCYSTDNAVGIALLAVRILAGSNYKS
ncbi:MAG TPA: O-sialoglycoprotein endopeptidase [Peptococcaceae bacterium]|nr:MAG: Peptidase M22 glycoprotease [Clostridia bacterium 41_269]HBT20442.1 O-sialoglycoprotein endopeptidase [Peptococcaceae bacterium]